MVPAIGQSRAAARPGSRIFSATIQASGAARAQTVEVSPSDPAVRQGDRCAGRRVTPSRTHSNTRRCVSWKTCSSSMRSPMRVAMSKNRRYPRSRSRAAPPRQTVVLQVEQRMQRVGIGVHVCDDLIDGSGGERIVFEQPSQLFAQHRLVAVTPSHARPVGGRRTGEFAEGVRQEGQRIGAALPGGTAEHRAERARADRIRVLFVSNLKLRAATDDLQFAGFEHPPVVVPRGSESAPCCADVPREAPTARRSTTRSGSMARSRARRPTTSSPPWRSPYGSARCRALVPAVKLAARRQNA